MDRDSRDRTDDFVVTNDFVVKVATVNGTGSASANDLLMQAIFRMGIPVSGKNVFPSNIQGLPTWYEIRVNKHGHLARSPNVDLMLAMNPKTYEQDINEVRPGGTVIFDSSWPLDEELLRADVMFFGVPLSHMCVENFKADRERTLMKNIAYVGAVAALLAIDLEVIEGMLEEKFSAKQHLMDSNNVAIRLGYDYAMEHFDGLLRIRLEAMDANRDSVLMTGNMAAALGCVYAGATVAAWYPITPATSLMDSFPGFLREAPQGSGDRQEPLLHHPSGGRARCDRYGAGCRLDGCSCVYAHERGRALLDERVPRHGLLRRDTGRHLRRTACGTLYGHAHSHPAGRFLHGRVRLPTEIRSISCCSRVIRGSVSTFPLRRSIWPSVSKHRCS